LVAVLPILLLAAAAHAHPVVSVDATALVGTALSDNDARRLRGALLVRLLEEGYPVAARARDAEVPIVVRGLPSGWSVQVRGARPETYHVEPGPFAVVSLEILQRATMALESLSSEEVASRTNRTSPGVAMAISTSAGDPLGSSLHRELALELSIAGMTLVPRSAPHDRLVCVTVASDVVALDTGTKENESSSPAVDIARTDRSDEEVAVEFRDQIPVLLDHWQRAERTRATHDPELDGASPTTPAIRSTRAANDSSAEAWQFGVGAGVGALVRVGGTDPFVSATGDVLAPSGLGVRLQGRFGWSHGLGPLSIVESSVEAGPRWVLPLGKSTAFGLALLGGVLYHGYYYSDTDQGSRLNWAFSLMGELSYQRGPVVLGIAIAPGISGPPRDHDISGIIMAWQRSAFSLGLAAFAGVVL
jgi:hypothetical protein